MEGDISTDDMDDGKVAYDNCQIDEAEGNRDPAVEIFQTLEAHQEESNFLEAAIIGFSWLHNLEFTNLQYRMGFLKNDRAECSLTYLGGQWSRKDLQMNWQRIGAPIY